MWGRVMPGRGDVTASYQPGPGGEGRGRPGQPPPLQQGVDAMLAARCQGRKTNPRSIFKFSCGHSPRSQEGGRGRWGRLLGEGGVEAGLTGQKGRVPIRTPGGTEALRPSWAPPGLCQLSRLEPHPPPTAKPPTLQLPLPLPVA